MSKTPIHLDNLFNELGLNTLNKGIYAGSLGWLDSTINLTSINPANEAVLAEVKCAQPIHYEKIIAQAQSTFLRWRELPAPARGELIRQISELLRTKKNALGQLVSLEMGKVLSEGLGEVQEMIDMADFAVGQSRMLYGKTMHSERKMHRMYEQWHPLGVVGVITAFNFPVAVWAWNAFIAAITGNTVIWKPSALVPLCAIAVQHLCNQVLEPAGFAGLFNLFVDPEHQVAEMMIQDKQVPLISYTGSTAVGRTIYEKVASRLGKCLLEMGGNNAIIVDESADLELAIPAIFFGTVGTAGQRCTTTRRLIVHQSLIDAVIQRLQKAYQQVRIGDPLLANTLMGPLINEQAVKNFEQAIAAVLQQGGEILAGAKTLPGPGYYVQPTILRAENHWLTVQHETFAPILYVMEFSQIDEAIALQNAVPQGLSSSLFTTNLQNAEIFLSSCGSDCGIANINIGTSGAEIGGAFGGEKETGGGREAGSDAWQTYMRRQTNTINWGQALPLAQGIQFELPVYE